MPVSLCLSLSYIPEIRIRLLGPDLSLVDAELMELSSGLHAVRFLPTCAGIYSCQLYALFPFFLLFLSLLSFFRFLRLDSISYF
jgi:hypothetical protein